MAWGLEWGRSAKAVVWSRCEPIKGWIARDNIKFVNEYSQQSQGRGPGTAAGKGPLDVNGAYCDAN